MNQKNKYLSESIDEYGLPLSEGVEIKIPFQHNGRPAEAVFDLEGGKIHRGGRVGPDESDEPEVRFGGAWYTDQGDELADVIPKEEIKDYRKIEDEAVMDYMSNPTHHYPEY